MRDTVVRYGIVIIFLLIFFTGCMKTQKMQEEIRTDKFITISSKIIDTGGIKTKKIETSSIEEYTETPGEVIADENLLVNITPVVRGKLKRLQVNPGDYVNKGIYSVYYRAPNLPRLFQIFMQQRRECP
jgi:multidrug efflux pump subunit AcrA (membrane-fusion protein)